MFASLLLKQIIRVPGSILFSKKIWDILFSVNQIALFKNTFVEYFVPHKIELHLWAEKKKK